VSARQSARAWFGGLVLLAGIALLVAIVRPGATAAASNADERKVFWTCEPLEPDSLASAWLLRRFVAPGCEIRVLKKGEVSPVGKPFDLPLVDWTRDRTHSTFHVIRDASRLDDRALVELADQVDTLELKTWNSPASRPASELEQRLRAILASGAEPASLLIQASGVLDEIYTHLAPPPEPSHG